MKICKICKRTLQENLFEKHKCCKNGFTNRCKSCGNKYRNSWRYTKKGVVPHQNNKSCSLYLGIHIVEKLLSNVFTNVIRMPQKNKGYDFICGKMFKVDVKSSCITMIDKKKQNLRWSFHIRKNKIADYFAFLALDNRQSLNPLHLWIVPGSVINNKITIAISNGTLSKWLQYEQSLDKVISGCNILKGILLERI